MTDQAPATLLARHLRNRATIEFAVMAFSLASFTTIGLSLVVTSWIAAVEGSVFLVGQLFFASSTTALVFSIYAGVVTDRKNRLLIIRQGQSLRILGVCALVVATLGTSAAPWLFAYAVLFSLGTVLNAGALDGIVQLAVDEQQRMKLAIRVSICRQLGILCGTGLGGVSLHHLPAVWPVLLMAVLMMVQFVIISLFFADYQNAPSKPPGHVISAWKGGLRAILGQPRLAFTILTIGLLFSASQMANVLVPGFVRDSLQQGSDVYGLLEMAWAAGGGAALATAAVRTRLSGAHRRELVILIMAGVAMVAFASSRSLPLLVAIYAILGGMFAWGRAICDGRILILAKKEEIGRVRAATSMVVSLLGMAIYVSPTIIGSEDAILYYVSWGVVLSVAGAVMLGLCARAGWN